jgi:primosomal protein N' (replication factor Y) (superfamily II helicase)
MHSGGSRFKLCAMTSAGQKSNQAQKVPPLAVGVLVPTPSARPYTYAVPDGWPVEPGAIVQVPLGPRLVCGVVWDGTPDDVDARKLKPLQRLFDCPPLDAPMRRFIDWVAHYTLTPPGLIARMVLRVPAAFDPEATIEALQFTGYYPVKMTGARKAALALVAENPVWTKAGLAKAAGIGASVIDGLHKAGCFETVHLPPPPVVPEPDIHYGAATLSEEQAAGAEALCQLAGAGFATALLDGVTGSGKTEVYFEAIAKAIESGKQALVLLPEIALTEAFLARFEARFGARPAEWHSGLPPRQREKVWRQAAQGRIRVVAGARSALFLPFKELGLIVVDEEHDPAYKQEESAIYHARDMAVVRGQLGGFPVILASATPSVESLVNVRRGRYKHIVLPGRFGDAVLPDLASIDMRRHPAPRGKFISPVLDTAIRATLAKNEQALLFLNRRGYAPLTLCRVCGHRFECTHCSSWLVEHRFRKQLQCHHCGHHEHSPEACPNCGTLDHLAACGPGVERIAEEVAAAYPDARIIVLSSDIMGGIKRLRVELDAIAKGEADIVIGTQLAAKGHNFPLMSLVGVLDADIGLSSADPRAGERTFQLLSQVTGRAGRFGLKSRGLIQTYLPDHPVMRALVKGDRDAFYQGEIELRERAALPPFARLAAIIISGEDRPLTEKHARLLAAAARTDTPLHVLGPAEAPMAMVRGRHRYRLLVQGPRASDIQGFIRAMLEAGPKLRGSIKVQVDIDPQSFL